ncbi:hypothetical protein NDU88_002917 [Pleurodeles waltl]|uniref:Uncharacterized protein n=1 Tax=Pleurodeles waltl TaxID=8319 RepID=A0AAV7UCK9_PLEWA|nr:hypothetical protein NDU88_002917 [Pleurodeles waltl]
MSKTEVTSKRGRKEVNKTAGNVRDTENLDSEDEKVEAVEDRRFEVDGEQENKWFEAECWDTARDAEDPATAQESCGLGGE